MKRRTRKKWTTDDDNTLIAMRKEGKTYKQVARKLKRSQNAVAARVTSLRGVHGDAIIHRGGVKQARVKLKAEKKRNARVALEEKDDLLPPGILPTDRSGRGQSPDTSPSVAHGSFRKFCEDLSSEIGKLKKRRDELLEELTEVGRQLANTRLEVEDKDKQLKSQAKYIIELASEQARLRSIIIEMAAERFPGE